MIKDFILPDIGEGVVECELVEWLVEEGQQVAEDQPIADVMTDKALVQIPAPNSGVISKLYYAQGEIALVHSPLYAVDIDAEASEASSEKTDPQIKASVDEIRLEDDKQHTSSSTNREVANSNADPIRSGKALASPSVRRMARENDIDLCKVIGSGKNGRVYKEDIADYLHGGSKADFDNQFNQVAEISVEQAALVSISKHEDIVEPIRGIKSIMAKQMMDSVSTIPHFTYCEELDVTDLMALRSQMKVRFETETLKISLMPFVMKAMSLALQAFPILNSQVNADCSELTYKASHNIGLAVDSKIGLLVPNVKNVQSKSILDIAADITRLIKDARDGRVAPADLKSGTITISNIGAIGGTIATPIVNKPEVAIVALGKIQKLPRFNDRNEVEARQIMQVSWSGDHRVIDGGTIARFCNLWKQYLESPQDMLLAMR